MTGIRDSKIAMVLLLAFSSAHATIEGTFWDPRFEGEGWTIESQNDLSFWTWYTYESNGDPTFRTAICDITYRLVGVFLQVQCNGSLYETRSRNQTTRLGSFSASFSLSSDGFAVGQVNAAGTRRTIVPFHFNFSNAIDLLHGVWMVSEFDGGETGESVLVLFQSFESQLNDGRPAREFVTSEGFPGFAYFEEQVDQFVAVVDFQNGTALVAVFLASDDKALGTTQITDSNFNPLQPEKFGLAASIANTEGELDALSRLLTLQKSQESTGLTPVPLAVLKRLGALNWAAPNE